MPKPEEAVKLRALVQIGEEKKEVEVSVPRRVAELITRGKLCYSMGVADDTCSMRPFEEDEDRGV
jgi:hypothetical protein